MAAAYRYAEGDGPIPDELQIATAIERFGVKAITGDDIMRPGLMRRIMLAENIVNGFKARARAANWAAFANDNPGTAALLVRAQEYANAE